MSGQTVLTILQAGQTIATFAPIAIDTALKIQQLLQQSQDFTVDIREIAANTIVVNNQTLSAIEQWRKEHSTESRDLNDE